MAELGWNKVSLFLRLLLQFTEVTGQHFFSFVVRNGDEVTLSCGNVTDGWDNCDSTTWIFSGPGNTEVQLIELGQIREKAKAKSDRLSIIEKCSLLMKKVTADDAGYYTCKQSESGHQQFEETQVVLSVINMTEHKDADKVTLNCSVWTYGSCRYTVKWLYEGKDVDKDNKDIKTSQAERSVAVTFLPSYLEQKSNYRELFQCKVTDGYTGKVQLFTFSLQSPGEKPVSTSRTGHSALDYIMLVIRVVELLLFSVITVLLIRARGNQRAPGDNTVLNSGRSRTVKRSGPAASQMNNDEDEEDDEVIYENSEDPSATLRLH
ncbi:uncharacterized protein LOC123977865 isoform X2 [Micropterus dolomieu]|uniref:uncharacterized protein LOC123977865 isoform X2 n=1 Tax=Micropterus dolomieu TaxID=147949 RepID=UPI001E8CC4CD|nr:uncharacterized protein LOC123977865 isoform X2 [Micropterus dolomieu]